MIIPDFLKQGDCIGVTAPSHGIDDETGKVRFASGAEQLKGRGYNVVFTPNVFAGSDRFGRSSAAEQKGTEFNALVDAPEIKAIYSASGGDFLAEMLEYVDLDLFIRNPKWVQGYSDNTSLLYYLTTKGDVATAYGANFSDFGMQPWQESVTRGLAVLEGKCTLQKSFAKYQDGFGERETGLECYSLDTPVKWKNICGGSMLDFEGRLIGGCMDVLLNISGTRFDGTLEFIDKYKDDGIIWYLESFSLGFEAMMEGLWKMKEMGWFEYATGIVFGRPLFYANEGYDGTPLPTYEDVLHERLDELNIPVILNADIGHKGPQFVMLNGVKAKVHSARGKGKIEFII